MTHDPVPAPPVVLDRRAQEFLRDLLALPADEAARIRDRTPSRRRPRPQYGPDADYGTDDPPGPDGCVTPP